MILPATTHNSTYNTVTRGQVKSVLILNIKCIIHHHKAAIAQKSKALIEIHLLKERIFIVNNPTPTKIITITNQSVFQTTSFKNIIDKSIMKNKREKQLKLKK